ncbi:MAG TPA: trypsin-like serine protease [Polyangiaceae bacterium]|nr:trypsin-like serine protease [Polyangiaceae bacterium]
MLCRKLIAWATFTPVLFGTGCSASDYTPEEDAYQIQDRIANGTTLSAASQKQRGLIKISSGCSGTLLNRHWVITARHCVATDGITSPLRPASKITISAAWTSSVATATEYYEFAVNAKTPTRDLILIHLGAGDLGDVPTQPILRRRLTTKDAVTQSGQGFSTFASGVWGNKPTPATGLGTYRTATFSPSRISSTGYELTMNASSQVGHGGDSGGPTVATAADGGLAGVQSTCHATGYVEGMPADQKSWSWATGISSCQYVSVEPFLSEIDLTIASVPNVIHVDRTAHTGARFAASAPTAIVMNDKAGIDTIAYRDSSGHLNEVWRDSAGFGTTDLTANAGAPAAQGNPFFYFEPTGNVVVLLYRANSAIHSLYWNFGAVGHDLLSNNAPAAASDPAGWFSQYDAYDHVVYRTTNNHLQELWWQGAGAVGNGDLTAAARAKTAAGDPWPYYDSTHAMNIVAFRGTDNHIRTLYWGSGNVGEDDLSGVAGTPLAADDPFAWHTPADDSNHFIYRASSGHIYELSYVNNAPVSGRDLTALTQAPIAVGKLSGGYNPADNCQHVIYRAADGSLHEMWYGLGSSSVGQGALNGGPPAVDRPVYFATAAAPHQHVAYRDANEHIHELLW